MAAFPQIDSRRLAEAKAAKLPDLTGRLTPVDARTGKSALPDLTGQLTPVEERPDVPLEGLPTTASERAQAGAQVKAEIQKGTSAVEKWAEKHPKTSDLLAGAALGTGGGPVTMALGGAANVALGSLLRHYASDLYDPQTGEPKPGKAAQIARLGLEHPEIAAALAGAAAGAARGGLKGAVIGAGWGFATQAAYDLADHVLAQGYLKDQPHVRMLLSSLAGGAALGGMEASLARWHIGSAKFGEGTAEGAAIAKEKATSSQAHRAALAAAYEPKSEEATAEVPDPGSPIAGDEAGVEEPKSAEPEQPLPDLTGQLQPVATAPAAATEGTPATAAEETPASPRMESVQPPEALKAAFNGGTPEQVRDALHVELNRHPDAITYSMPVGAIEAEPSLYQFKSNVNRETGADAALSRVGRYDEAAANVLTVHHRKNGHYYVVDGHGRRMLRQKLDGPNASVRVQMLEENLAHEPGALPGAVRYSVTPEQARTFGAYLNIMHGHGTALDQAEVLRHDGFDANELIHPEAVLPRGTEKVERVLGLSNLSGRLWKAVKIGDLPEKVGGLLGGILGTDFTAQEAAYRVLKDRRLLNRPLDQISEMIHLAKGGPEGTERQQTLFGREEFKRNLIAEQAMLLTDVKHRIATDRSLFGRVAKGAGRIEEAKAGWVDPVTSQGLSDEAAQVYAQVSHLAHVAGPIQKALRAAATELAAKPKERAAIADRLYDHLVAGLSKKPREGAPAPVATAAAPASEVVPAAPSPSVEAKATVAPEPASASPGVPEGQTELYSGVPLPHFARVALNWLRGLANVTADNRRSIVEAFRRAVIPEMRGPYARAAKEIWVAGAGAQRAIFGSVVARLADAQAVRARQYFEKMPGTQAWEIVALAEKGQYDALPEAVRPFFLMAHTLYDDVYEAQARMPEGAPPYIPHYIEHMWKESPDDARQRLPSLQEMGGKKLVGRTGFRRERILDTMLEGIQKGLTPLYSNPVDMITHSILGEWRYVTGRSLFSALKAVGLAKLFPSALPKTRLRNGWTVMEDPLAAVFQWSPEEKGFVYRGQYAMPEQAARVINNHLMPGWRPGNPIGDLFRWVTFQGNRLRVFGLFHFGLISNTAADLDIGQHLDNAMVSYFDGKPLKAGLELSKIPKNAAMDQLLAIPDVRLGTMLNRLAQQGHFDEPMIRALIRAGASFDFGPTARSLTDTINDSLIQQMGLPGRWRLPLGNAVGSFVTRAKLGAFARLYNAETTRLMEAQGGAALTELQARRLGQEIWRHLDDTMGQIAADNLHFSRRFKDTLGALIAFPGWNIGTVRLAAGIARGGAEALAGEKLDSQARYAVRYASAKFLRAGIEGALVNLFMTGQLPRNLYETFAWPTGEKDQDGNEIRAKTPEYLIRDLESGVGRYKEARGAGLGPGLAAVKSMIDVSLGKVNPLWAAGMELYQNRDFWNHQIYYKDDPDWMKVARSAAHEAGEYEPFGVSNAAEILRREGINPLSPTALASHPGAVAKAGAVGLLGFQPVQRSLRETAAQTYVRAQQTHIDRPMSAQQAQANQILGRFEAQARARFHGGKTPPDIDSLRQAYQQGLITAPQIAERLKAARMSPFEAGVYRLPLPETVQAWSIAKKSGDRRDQEIISRMIMQKIRKHAWDRLPPATKRALAPTLREMIRDQGGLPAAAAGG
jgi:hypothetical protein